MQPGQARFRFLAARVHEGFRLESAPFLPERGGGGAGGCHVLRVKTGIADDANGALNAFQRLARRLDNRATEIARNPVIGLRCPQPLEQKGLATRLPPRATPHKTAPRRYLHPQGKDTA